MHIPTYPGTIPAVSGEPALKLKFGDSVRTVFDLSLSTKIQRIWYPILLGQLVLKN